MTTTRDWEDLNHYLAWRKEGTGDGWAHGELQRGNLDYWLDPVLPLYCVQEPETYGRSLKKGCFHALQGLAHGRNVMRRTAVRTLDSYTTLRSCVTQHWEKREVCLGSLLALFPPVATADNKGKVELDAEVVVGPMFQSMLVLILKMLKEVMPDDPESVTRQVTGPLRAWAVDPLRSLGGLEEIFANLPLEFQSEEDTEARLFFACRWIRYPDDFVRRFNLRRAAQSYPAHPTHIPALIDVSALTQRLLSHISAPPCLKYLPRKDLVGFDEYPALLMEEIDETT